MVHGTGIREQYRVSAVHVHRGSTGVNGYRTCAREQEMYKDTWLQV